VLSSSTKSLPALLAARAESCPQDPWLFQVELLEWRWRSWVRIAEQAAGAAAALAHLPAGTRVGLDGRPGADAVTLDLAVQAADLVSMPLCGENPRERAREAGCAAWLEAGSSPVEEMALEGLERISAPPVRPRLEPWPQGLEITLPEGRGGVVAEGREIGQDTLLAQAQALAERIPSLGERHVAFGFWGLDHPGGRAFAAWSLVTGAALLLEPQADAVPPGLLWTRPSVVHARAEELEAVAAALADRSRRRWSRLRAFILDGPDEPSAEARHALERAGAEIVGMPAF